MVEQIAAVISIAGLAAMEERLPPPSWLEAARILAGQLEAILRAAADLPDEGEEGGGPDPRMN